jgi:Protein of unknown function (DUF3303)
MGGRNSGTLLLMLFMIIEHFRDKKLLRERFQRQGRMLPENVVYQASWIDPATDNCYQLMEAPDVEALTPWIERWKDIVDFAIIPVLASQEYWARAESQTTHAVERG